jgi:hypothetical protein
MVDYAKLAITAQRLVRQSGRSITFVKKERTPADPLKPWNGAIDGEDLLVLDGVFVTPNQVRIFGLSALGDGVGFQDMIAFSEQLIITFPGENNLREYQTIRDNDVNWNVAAYQFLKPADITLLAFIGVRR